jgi:hypothetical protein
MEAITLHLSRPHFVPLRRACRALPGGPHGGIGERWKAT